MHDLQPLNAVTIQDSGAPPILEFYVDISVGQGSYMGLYFFVAFDNRNLAIKLRDLTTFQTPLSLLCLTTLPMGATNSVQILQGDISFIIQDEMPTFQQPSWMMSMSEGLLLSTKPTVQDGIYPLLLWIPHHSPLLFCAPLLQTSHTSAQMVNTLTQIINTMRLFQRTLGSVGSFGSIWMMWIVSSSMSRKLEEPFQGGKERSRRYWIGMTEILSEVCSFLGVCGIIWIWVKDFTKCARPLVILTKKEMDFVWAQNRGLPWRTWIRWSLQHHASGQLDYHSNQCVILVVDSSCIAMGFILLRLGMDNKCYPSYFGSITWN